jgi:hypothetical protein
MSLTEGEAYGHGESGRSLPPKRPGWLERRIMRLADYLRDKWYDRRHRTS